MNSMQRVMATLQGAEVDRPPVFAVMGAYGGKLTNIPLPELYQHPENWERGQIAIQNAFKLDMVLGTFDFSKIAEAFGGQPVLFERQAPNMQKPGTTNPLEALNQTVPNIPDCQPLQIVLEGVSRLKNRYQGEIPVVSAVPGPAAIINLIIGIESWLDCALFDSETADKLFDHIVVFWENWVNALAEAGTDFVVVTEGMSSNTICTRDIFFINFYEKIERAFRKLKFPIIYHHTGGSINHVLDILSDLPNVAGFVVSSKDDLTEARGKIKPEHVLLGNIDNLSFPKFSPNQIELLALDRLVEMQDKGAFIIANSAADIPLDTQEETLHAYVNAVKSFGKHLQKDGGNADDETRIIACGVLKNELLQLQNEGHLNGNLEFLSSRLHMQPPKLQDAINEAITKDAHKPTKLIYGDCCPLMLQISEKSNIDRIPCVNCVEMLLGKKRYKELIKKGYFFLLPEWAKNWKEIIVKELGLTRSITQELMSEMCKGIIYLDTGVVPIPKEELQACQAFTGLSIQIKEVGLRGLKNNLDKLP